LIKLRIYAKFTQLCIIFNIAHYIMDNMQAFITSKPINFRIYVHQ